MSIATSRTLRRPGFVLAAAAALAAPGAALAIDLATTAIVRPVSGCALTSMMDVTISIFNYGPTLPAATSFNVSYTINGGGPVVELVTLAAPLSADSKLDYTFTTQANLSVPGTYTFNGSVSLAGDATPANDALNGYVVTNDAPSNAGTLQGPSTGTSGTLTLAGNTGAVTQWEESEDDGARWFALSNTTASQQFANLRTPTKFRARVADGSCPDAISNNVTVTP